MAPSKSAVQPQTPMAALEAAIANAPDLSNEISAVKAAQNEFDAIKAKATETHTHNYAAELNETHGAMVAAQARFDIAKGSAEDLAKARDAYAVASDKADAAPGRRAILLDELEKSREAIAAAVRALEEARYEWASEVENAARSAEVEAVRLLVNASVALRFVDPERGWLSAGEIISTLPGVNANFGGGRAVHVGPEVVQPDQINYANVVHRRANLSLDYLADSTPIGRSVAATREANLAPAEIERARVTAIAKANQGHSVPAYQPPPEDQVFNSGVEGFAYSKTEKATRSEGGLPSGYDAGRPN